MCIVANVKNKKVDRKVEKNQDIIKASIDNIHNIHRLSEIE